jgi:hypothetical protein
MPDVLLRGSLTLNAVDVSDWVTEFKISRTRDVVEVPATLGTGTKSRSAGAHDYTLSISFLSETAASSAWATLWDAMETDSAEIPFAGKLQDAAVSATNPSFAGTILVTALDTGGTVGSLQQSSHTYPIKAGTLVRTTTP